MRWKSRIGLLFCLLMLLLSMSFVIRVHSQGTSCYFTSTKLSPPEGTGVPAGQPVSLLITVTGSCPTPGTYTIRADVFDTGTSQGISTSQTELTASGQFATSLSNSIVTPSTSGWWSLRVSVYIFANGAMVAPPSQLAFGLEVVPSTQILTTQSVVQPTTLTQHTIESTVNPTVSAQPQSLSTENQITPLSRGPGLSYGSDMSILLGIALGLLVSIPVLIFRFRRHS